MFSKLHERLGTAGLVVAIVALVVALGGTAFAAKKFITKQEAIKIAKKYAGKNGAPGATGPQGPAGSAGKDGAGGAPGKEGPQGKEGPEGEEGPPGQDGSPWVAGGTLPSGQTETGMWSLSGTYGAGQGGLVSISFPIPLAAELSGTTEPEQNGVHAVTTTGEEFNAVEGAFEPSVKCQGPAAAPKALAGNLCVYMIESTFPAPFGTLPQIKKGGTGASEGATVAGAVLQFINLAETKARAAGSFAVTAP
jgi:hypothetical protein